MSSFEIPDGPSTIALKQTTVGGKSVVAGSASFTVNNKAGQQRSGRLKVVPLGGAKAEWFDVEGQEERPFADADSQKITVQVAIPGGVAVGEAKFRLQALNVNDPDNDYAESAVVTMSAPARVEPPPPINWRLIIAIAGALLLVVLAVILYLAFGRGKSEAPGGPTGAEIGNFTVTNQQVPDFPGWAQQPNTKIASGDFDNDGKVDDIAMIGGAGWGSIPIAYGQGGGNFTITNQPAPDFPGWAQQPNTQIVSGDFDNDGKVDDIAMVGGPGWTTIPVAYGNGGGNFTITNQTVPEFPGWAQAPNTKIVSGDFDGDGKVDDIAMVGGPGWTTIPVAYGQGGGNFTITNQTMSEFPSLAQAPNTKIVSGDFDGDGKVDDIAIFGGPGWTTIAIAYGQGGGNFTVTNQPVPDFPGWAVGANTKIVSADLDGDGKIDDVALAGAPGWATIPVAFGQGGGNFKVTNQSVSDFPGLAQWSNTKMVSGDFDGDGKVDDVAIVGGQGWTTLPVAYGSEATPSGTPP